MLTRINWLAVLAVGLLVLVLLGLVILGIAACGRDGRSRRAGGRAEGALEFVERDLTWAQRALQHLVDERAHG